MFPQVRPLWYITVVWSLSIALVVSVYYVIGQGFDYAVYIGWPILAITNAATAGFGIAESLQNWFDARKLRKQAENFLYDQTSFHSEGGY